MANISFRTDPETDRALDILAPSGSDRSEAIRAAVLAAARRHREDELRAEAVALASDPGYLAELEAVKADMEDLRAW